MPLPLSAFPEFQTLQLLCAQAATHVSYLEEQIPELVDTLEACRLTNLSYASLRRVRTKTKSLIIYKNGRYNRESLLAHNDSRTIWNMVTSPANKSHFDAPKRVMKQALDLTEYTEFQELQQHYQQLMVRIAELERKLPEWVDMHEAQRITCVSTATLGRWRDKSDSPLVWKVDCGIHYERASLLAYNKLRTQVRPRGRHQS